MKLLRILPVTLGAVLALSACMHEAASDSLTNYSGKRLFETLCANCHGLDGTGNGFTAPYTAGHPPDLTGIAARNGGTFPAEKVFRTIDGQFDSPGPGARHMPIWGYDLFTGEGDDETAHQQVLDVEHRLVTYVGSIQQPATVSR
jgi:mono/diheme cytochrome c family protein